MSEKWIDRAWKDVIKGNLDDAIAFFMPNFAAERDYSETPEAADPVRPAIDGKSDEGSNISDACFKVPLTNGSCPLSLFLIEQQHEEDKSIPLRVFQSWYRASDEYQFPVTALVIYTGGAKPVNTYSHEWHGTSVIFVYNTYCVPKDADVEELKRDKRPFAIPVLAAKRMYEAKRDPAKRGEYSLELLELIKTRKFDDKKTWSFMKFTSRILQIDEDDMDPKIREEWKVQFKPMDEVVKEIYVQAAKEEGIEEGIEKGIEKGIGKGIELKALKVVRKMLERGMDLSDIAELVEVPIDKVQALAGR